MCSLGKADKQFPILTARTLQYPDISAFHLVSAFPSESEVLYDMQLEFEKQNRPGRIRENFKHLAKGNYHKLNFQR